MHERAKRASASETYRPIIIFSYGWRYITESLGQNTNIEKIYE